MIQYFGHAGEDHSQPEVSFVTKILHQPTWIELMAVGILLGLIFILSRKLQFVSRLMVLVASMIIVGIAYLPYNPTVTAVVLSVGFIATFLLTFTILAGTKSK